MGNSKLRLYAAIAAIAFTSLCSTAPAAEQPTVSPQSCDAIFEGNAVPTVSDAYNDAYRATPNASGSKIIELGDIVTIKGKNLAQMFTGPCASRTVVLFLNDQPMKGVVRDPPSDPNLNLVHFTLIRTEEANAAWVPILGSPLSHGHQVDVSMGFQDGFALKSTNPRATRLTFSVVPRGWFALWAAIFVVMIAVFIYFAACTNIIRDPGPVSVGTLGIFSLSRLQGAWWFFVIVAAYLFIGIVTGDFSNSINSTALILLGIGAGTVVGSAAIDAQKNTDAQQAATLASIADVQAHITAAQQAIYNIGAQLNADNPAPNAVQRHQLMSQRVAQTATKARLDDQLRMLQGRSKNILFDILTDANGISFHRFQIAAFTVILSIIFTVEVYQTLAMPTFNTTLMGMLGLSAGTYLGLKIPEATTPTKT